MTKKTSVLSPSITLAACVIALAACTSPPPPRVEAPPAPPPTLAPNAQLIAQGIPAVPMQLVQDVAKYTEFRGHRFADWHPTLREMVIVHRPAGGNTAQLFRITTPMGTQEQLTQSADPITTATYEPREGKYVMFERSTGGSEADQLYRFDLSTKQEALITDPIERHSIQGWLHKGSQLLVASLPLDKTAQGGTRAKVTTTFRLLDPMNPQAARKVAELDGGGWYVGGISSDDKQVTLTRYVSATESQVWLMELATGKARQLLPAPGSKEKATYLASEFMPGNAGLYVLSDRAGEFRELNAYRLSNRRLTRMSSHIPWDVQSVAVSEDGSTLAAKVNVDGREELRLFSGKTLKEVPAPKLPSGGLEGLSFHRKTGELAFSLDTAQSPSQLHTLAFNGPAASMLVQWTRAYAPPGVDVASFTEQSIVRWKSFDGRSISGLLSTPPARFSGKRPVIVAIHGGPESQATMGFMGRSSYYVNELGIAVIEPNVRGSSGYGKSFLSLDDGMKREDAVKDIGALLDWIATQPQLDASKVVVTGGSYGGYMSLAVATHYADRIAGAIDIVGISNFVTFLEKTESYRRDLRRAEYGDERDPKMREFLEKISPLTSASKISKPLFVVQGRNDPRVPYTEAEQIVAKARANGTAVWYLRAENEGHGFYRKENSDYQFYATILFLQQTLGLR